METLLEFDCMRLEKKNKLAWVTFTRQLYLNAMNSSATLQINRVAKAIREDPDLRIIIIRGLGRAFCTGLDLKEFSTDKIEMSYFVNWDNALRIFETIEKIVVVGMHGYCLGGALQLALAADIRVSTPDCQIGLPAIKESLVPGLGPWRLPKYIGMGRAKKLLFGGENISGEEAMRIGLVDHIAPNEDFFQHLDQIAEKYLKACSVGARMSKLLVNNAFDMDFDSAFQYYLHLQDRTYHSMDAEEARRAYREKRDPNWQ